MKRSRQLMIVVFAALLFAACADGRDITTEKTTEQPKEPAIVLGDENLPDQEKAERVEKDDHIQAAPVREEDAEPDTADGSISALENTDGLKEPTDMPALLEGPALLIGAAPENAVSEGRETDADGGYTETLLCEDGKVRLSASRMKDIFSEHTIDEIQQYYMEKGEWQQILSAEEDDLLTEAVGYPVLRFRYVTGEGEESVMHNSIYIVHDAYGFFLDASADASDYPDVEELTETWIGSVSISEEG